ncbi:hypothetical protein GCM10009739_29220 [Microbacterium ulmi]
MPSGESRVLVDVDAFEDGWPGWDAAPGGHVVAPLDVLRVSRGHLAVLPLCVERLDDVVARRDASGATLTDGERLTVAVSLVRGLAELATYASADATGAWWVTSDARPVFAPAPHGQSAAASTEALLRRLAAASERLGAALEAAAGLVTEPSRVAREAERIEEGLFAAATPEPLALTVFSPRQARALSVHRETGDAILDEEAPGGGLFHHLARHVDSDLADLASRATTAVWRALHRRPRERRAGPWVAAGVLVAAIVGGAALLPSAADEPTSAASPTLEPGQRVPSASSSDDEDPPQPQVGGDLESIASALLEARLACRDDVACLGSVLAEPSASLPPGAIDLAATARTITLVDEFGGAAVLRVAANDGAQPAQLVVVIREDERWLLRDVHDVAEQPSS